ncbi:MAG: DUF1214 domain-containing protein [Myxococcota bacterium]
MGRDVDADANAIHPDRLPDTRTIAARTTAVPRSSVACARPASVRVAILWLALAGLALACAPTEPEPEAATPATPVPRATLATPGQLAREARALDVLASEPIHRATDALERLYRANPRGRTPSGAATARRAAESMAAAAVYSQVNDDPDRPVLFWGANAAHRWSGLALPRAGFGIENPDNVYRHLDLDGATRYAIRGRWPENGPAELHFVVMDRVPGSSKEAMPIEGAGLVATLRSDAIVRAADGGFTITIDAEPANGRANHLQIPSSGRFPLYVRDLFTDWSRQDPVALEAFRLDGPEPAPVPTVEAQAEAAAARLDRMGAFWLEWNDRFLYTQPANALTPPRDRPGGRGLSVAGHFELAEDEVLVIVLDPLGAGSVGIQLADPWGVAYEYVERTGSLNQTQATANADGSLTFVVAREDPGVHNWLDAEGQSAGILVARWQVMPERYDAGQAIRAVRTLKRSTLRASLPAETRFLTPEERADQRAERARQYERRLTR